MSGSHAEAKLKKDFNLWIKYSYLYLMVTEILSSFVRDHKSVSREVHIRQYNKLWIELIQTKNDRSRPDSSSFIQSYLSDNKIQMRSYSEILQVIFTRALKEYGVHGGILRSLTESYRKLYSRVHIFCLLLLDAVVMGSLSLYFWRRKSNRLWTLSSCICQVPTFFIVWG